MGESSGGDVALHGSGTDVCDQYVAVIHLHAKRVHEALFAKATCYVTREQCRMLQILQRAGYVAINLLRVTCHKSHVTCSACFEAA